MTLEICCVKVGTKYDDAYVHKLKHGIERHLPKGADVAFTCYVDRPVSGIECRPLVHGLPGWWSKLELFSLEKPMLYFDLDVVITGDLSPLLEWEGFGILKDPYLRGNNSSVMKLTGNEGRVWKCFDEGKIGMMRGDQDWITLMMPDAKTFPDHWIQSFKFAKCVDAPPKDAIAVNFHGFPKCHQVGGWVKDYWTVGDDHGDPRYSAVA